MKGWIFGDWTFGSAKRSYIRARRNEAEATDRALQVSERATQKTLSALAGPESFPLGTLADGTPVRVAAEEVGRHGMVWGASGAGKSYGIHLLTEGWTVAGRHLELIDPKGETFLLKALAAAAKYRSLGESKREAFAARFRVLDMDDDRLTPADLWIVPHGMAPALLASLRAAATTDLVAHTFSDLMAYGLFLLYSAAIHFSWGITVKLTRAFFLDAAFRTRIASQAADARLRDSIENLETTLPEQTRKAIVRQFDILLASSPARISFGLSPAMVRELLPQRDEADITLGNFGPTPQRTPALAKTMATNRLINVLTSVNVRTEIMPELLVLEEVGVLVKQPAVAEYLLEASRTLRWKGLGIVCVAQDPANAIPKETATALVLNAKWLLGFECGREESLWLLPHMGMSGQNNAEAKRAFMTEMATLPTQHAVFVRKGLQGLRLRLRDVADPLKTADRAALMETFRTKIAARSMVRIAAAERLIARFESDLFAGSGVASPAAGKPPDSPTGHAQPQPQSVEDFLALLKKARGEDAS